MGRDDDEGRIKGEEEAESVPDSNSKTPRDVALLDFLNIGVASIISKRRSVKVPVDARFVLIPRDFPSVDSLPGELGLAQKKREKRLAKMPTRMTTIGLGLHAE